MNYDKINRVLEKKPWITIVMAFIVVSLCLFILFSNYGGKPDTTKVEKKSAAKPVVLVETDQTTRMMTQNQNLNKSNLPPHQQPLLDSLTEVQCSLHQHRFVPLCPRCNVPLEFLSGHTFQCPICKQKVDVVCPVCGKAMDLVQGPAGTDAIYYCPICKKEVVPNWEKNGTPICPYCNNHVILNGETIK